MRADRFTIVALCLGLALILMTGSAMAGTTTFTALKYAKETGVATTNNYILPIAGPSGYVDHAFTNYLPVVGQDFLVKVKLTATPDTVVFVNTGASDRRTGTYEIIPTGAAGAATCTGAGSGGSYTTITWTCTVAADFDAPPIFRWYYFNGPGGLPATPVMVRDVPGVIAAGGTISIGMTAWDAIFQSVQLDGEATDVTPFIKGVPGVQVTKLTTSSRVIDITDNRTTFVGNGTEDGDSAVEVLVGDPDETVWHRSGNPFVLTTNVSSIVLTITSTDMTGITRISYDPFGLNVGLDAPEEGFTGPVVLQIPGGFFPPGFAVERNILIQVDGETALANREIDIKVQLNIGGGQDGFPGITTLKNTTMLTTWASNGTVLFVPWTNGNGSAMNGRIYLFNHSNIGAPVVAQIYTMPVKGVATQLVGTVTVGTLDGMSGMNIKVKEDLLDALGIAQPYGTNGGNLAVILSIEAQNVVGTANVFNTSFSYGMLSLVRLN